MKFGPIAIAAAAGAILAHTVRRGELVMRKGTVLDQDAVGRLAAAGVTEVVAARLEADDVHEDEAAARLARAVAGRGLTVAPAFTGRANLHAGAAGVAVIDRAAIDRCNRVDPAVTVATLPEFAAVEPGRMVATVKIIPFAVGRSKLEAALAAARGAVWVAPFRPVAAGLVATTLPALRPAVMDKTRRLLEERLAPAGASLLGERRVAHDRDAVAAALTVLKEAGAGLLVVFGASATVDADDVVPAAVAAAGGRVVHVGMPVDPGNLLVLGDLGGVPVVGAPGCARSPKENGFDWVLRRLLAGIEVTSADVTGLGVGGLLMEIVSRPQPREAAVPPAPADASRVAAVVLAAGRSRRMGGPSKLLATVGGKPLVRVAAEAALASRAGPVSVVTGDRAGEVTGALSGLDLRLVHNPDYRDGLSTSLRAGLAALSEDVAGAVILLADMPGIDAAAIDRLVDAFDPEAGALIVVATAAGRRGNPVLWSRRYFPELMAVRGDVGGRGVIEANPDAVVEVEVGPDAALDVDTPDALAAVGGMLPEP